MTFFSFSPSHSGAMFSHYFRSVLSLYQAFQCHLLSLFLFLPRESLNYE